MIPNLNGACYAVRSTVLISNIRNVKSIYYAYFHCTGLFEMIVGVLTTCPTQYT